MAWLSLAIAAIPAIVSVGSTLLGIREANKQAGIAQSQAGIEAEGYEIAAQGIESAARSEAILANFQARQLRHVGTLERALAQQEGREVTEETKRVLGDFDAIAAASGFIPSGQIDRQRLEIRDRGRLQKQRLQFGGETRRAGFYSDATAREIGARLGLEAAAYGASATCYGAQVAQLGGSLAQSQATSSIIGSVANMAARFSSSPLFNFGGGGSSGYFFGSG